MNTQYIIIIIAVIAVAVGGYVMYTKYAGTIEKYTGISMKYKVVPEITSKRTGRTSSLPGHYSTKLVTSGETTFFTAPEKAIGQRIYGRGNQPAVGPFLRIDMPQSDVTAGSEGYSSNATDAVHVDADGNEEEVVIHDRLMVAPAKSRHLAGSDFIRGDLFICPNENSGWFNVSVNPLTDLNRGALSQIAGSNEASKNLDDYHSLVEGMMTNKEVTLSGQGNDIVVY